MSRAGWVPPVEPGRVAPVGPGPTGWAGYRLGRVPVEPGCGRAGLRWLSRLSRLSRVPPAGPGTGQAGTGWSRGLTPTWGHQPRPNRGAATKPRAGAGRAGIGQATARRVRLGDVMPDEARPLRAAVTAWNSPAVVRPSKARDRLPDQEQSVLVQRLAGSHLTRPIDTHALDHLLSRVPEPYVEQSQPGNRFLRRSWIAKSSAPGNRPAAARSPGHPATPARNVTDNASFLTHRH